MHQAGPFNPAFGAESFGLKDLKSISYNFEAPRLVEETIQRAKAFDQLYADMLGHAKG